MKPNDIKRLMAAVLHEHSHSINYTFHIVNELYALFSTQSQQIELPNIVLSESKLTKRKGIDTTLRFLNGSTVKLPKKPKNKRGKK
jgi:hypothetical protein